VAIGNVPYSKWHLVVHLGAGVNGWDGKVELLKASGVRREPQSVNYGWIGNNRYVEGQNYVVFRGLAGKAAVVRAVKEGGKGTAAIAGVQVVPAK